MKPTIPDVFDRFAAYYEEHPAWGSLHIVLDDQNVEDGHVEFCRGWALEHDDPEGAELAVLLLAMSKTQRIKIGRRIGFA